MALTADDLAAIDRQLDELGKTDAEISAIVARARAIVASLEDVDAALEELAAGRAIPVTPTRAREEPSTDVHAAPAVEAQHGAGDDRPARTSDIAGLSVDELFADAEPSAAPAGGGLAGLFDDEPLSLSESELGLDVGDAAALYDEQGLADALEDEAPLGLADSLEDELAGLEGGLADALEDELAPLEGDLADALEIDALEGDVRAALAATRGGADALDAGAPLDGGLADAPEEGALAGLEGGLADALEADEPSPAAPSPFDDDGDDGDDGGLAAALAHARAAEGEDVEVDWPEDDTSLMRAVDFEGVRFAEAARATEPEASADLVEPEPARPRTMPPPIPSRPPPPESLSMIGEEEEEEPTNILTGADFARLTGAASHSDEFELLVDEELLEIDDDELEELPDEPEPDGDEKRGLISRILGRK